MTTSTPQTLLTHNFYITSLTQAVQLPQGERTSNIALSYGAEGIIDTLNFLGAVNE